MSERRIHDRIPFPATVRFTHPSCGTRELSMKDLSDSGICLDGAVAGVASGDVVQIQAVEPPGAPLLNAKVVRVTADDMALLFLF